MFIILGSDGVVFDRSTTMPVIGPRGLILDEDRALACADDLTPVVEVPDAEVPADFVGGKYLYQGGAFILNPDWVDPITNSSADQAIPTLKVVGIAPDVDHAAATVIAADFSEITCPAGTVLTVSAELQDGANAIIPLSGAFRMPLIASDGRERIVNVTMVAGVASFAVPLAESGVWSVTQSSINRDLPAAQHMAFAGIKVFVTL